MKSKKTNKMIFSVITVIAFVVVELILNNFLELQLQDHIMIGASLLVALIAINISMVAGLFTTFIVVLFYGIIVIFSGTTDYIDSISISYRNLAMPILSGMLFGLINLVNTSQITVSDGFENNFEELVRIDDLTGFRNKRDFKLNMEEEIHRVNRYGGELSLVLINIESFESMNRLFGLNQGNQFLKYLSEFIVEVTRNVDKHYRISQDQFAIILPNTDLNGAEILKHRFITELEDVNIQTKSDKKNLDIEVDVVFQEYSNKEITSEEFIKSTKFKLESAN